MWMNARTSLYATKCKHRKHRTYKRGYFAWSFLMSETRKAQQTQMSSVHWSPKAVAERMGRSSYRTSSSSAVYPSSYGPTRVDHNFTINPANPNTS
uniref:Uncharacterized protein n=1 Tax=Ascaris lumbricoides TaxID=6252 RepID=A0A0M3HHX8_ASCLU